MKTRTLVAGLLWSLLTTMYLPLADIDARAAEPLFSCPAANIQIRSLAAPDLSVIGINTHDAVGNDLSLGVRGERYGLTISAYVYPRKAPDFIDEFRATVQTMLTAHPKAELASSGATQMSIGEVRTSGMAAMILFNESAGELGSFLFLFPHNKDYVLKLRATYERKPGEETDAMEYTLDNITKVLGSFEPIEKTDWRLSTIPDREEARAGHE